MIEARAVGGVAEELLDPGTAELPLRLRDLLVQVQVLVGGDERVGLRLVRDTVQDQGKLILAHGA